MASRSDVGPDWWEANFWLSWLDFMRQHKYKLLTGLAILVIFVLLDYSRAIVDWYYGTTDMPDDGSSWHQEILQHKQHVY